jgi:DNA-binding MarR family transcriptional regulator
MADNNIKLTELEKELLRCWSIERTFCSEVQSWNDAVWAFAVRDIWKEEGNNPSSLCGVISSLIKKNILDFQDNSHERYKEDRNDTIWFTEKGSELMEQLHPRFTKKSNYYEKLLEELRSTYNKHLTNYTRGEIIIAYETLLKEVKEQNT